MVIELNLATMNEYTDVFSKADDGNGSHQEAKRARVCGAAIPERELATRRRTSVVYEVVALIESIDKLEDAGEGPLPPDVISLHNTLAPLLEMLLRGDTVRDNADVNRFQIRRYANVPPKSRDFYGE